MRLQVLSDYLAYKSCTYSMQIGKDMLATLNFKPAVGTVTSIVNKLITKFVQTLSKSKIIKQKNTAAKNQTELIHHNISAFIISGYHII